MTPLSTSARERYLLPFRFIVFHISLKFEIAKQFEEWLKDTRSCGFKRSAPRNAAEYNRVQQERAEQGVRRTQVDPAGRNESSNQSAARYCHFWNNLGKCNRENCVFLHQNAPLCKFDGNCGRSRCMFSHEKQNMHFLSNNTKPPQPPTPRGPWPSMMPPWMNPFPFNGNPWMDMGRNSNRRN